jgi:hypothetical protein
MVVLFLKKYIGTRNKLGFLKTTSKLGVWQSQNSGSRYNKKQIHTQSRLSYCSSIRSSSSSRALLLLPHLFDAQLHFIVFVFV